jgi:hypothetical protein
MAAIYFKLYLRFTNLSGFFFALDRDYHYQKSNDKIESFFQRLSPESAKIAAYAHQKVLAILKTLETKEERLDFLNQISYLSLFEKYNNYKNYRIFDDGLELLEESPNDSSCTIS